MTSVAPAAREAASDLSQELKVTQIAARTITQVKAGLWLICLLPLIRLMAGAATDRLGADPVEAITRSTGIWALNFLLLSLTFTPLRRITGWHWVVRFRRLISLFAFFYACLHFLAYLVFDQFFDWPGVLVDVRKRPYITMGIASFLLLLPLAITSTEGMMRRLGGRWWQRLHRLTYVIAGLAVFHFLWLVKRDLTMPAIYIALLGTLFCARMVKRRRRARAHSVLVQGAGRAPGT